jgi:predicted porin
MTTGLLPHFLSIGGSTRQNDLDVTFAISIQPGTSNLGAFGNESGQNNRQAFLTFGDKSWGTFKLGKDLGVFASDAILNDMTLLGVGAPNSAGTNTTLGRIGTGYIYADWKPQISYTTPNFSGLQATVAISQGWNGTGLDTNGATVQSTNRSAASPAYEGKASYSFAANDVTGKVWVSGIAQKIDGKGTGVITAAAADGTTVAFSTGQGAVTMDDSIAYGGDIGANVNVAGFGLTGYYYAGNGLGTTGQFMQAAYYKNANKTVYLRDSDGGYVQATYVLPTKTKIGASWGISNLDKADNEGAVNGALVKENEMWTIGAYHPLTKHLNLVAEYSNVKSESHSGLENKNYTGSLGAILFF